MTTLATQATARPTRKKMFQDIAQFVIVGIAFGLGFVNIDVPPGLEGLAVAAAGSVIGYFVLERQ